MQNIPLFPRAYSQARVISSIGQWSNLLAINNAEVSATFPTAKKVIYCPIRVPFPCLVQQLYIENGAAVSGNVDVGLYSADGTKIISAGSTAQSGTNAPQLFNITDTQIGAGMFYVAVSLDNTTGTLLRFATNSLALAAALGLLTETTGSFGLPATATFASIADNYVPDIGLVIASTL